jgi:hypothetical protein
MMIVLSKRMNIFTGLHGGRPQGITTWKLLIITRKPGDDKGLLMEVFYTKTSWHQQTVLACFMDNTVG